MVRLMSSALDDLFNSLRTRVGSSLNLAQYPPRGETEGRLCDDDTWRHPPLFVCFVRYTRCSQLAAFVIVDQGMMVVASAVSISVEQALGSVRDVPRWHPSYVPRETEMS